MNNEDFSKFDTIYTVDEFDNIIKNHQKFKRIKINDNVKCTEPKCIKYATYKNLTTNKCICWLHYYLFIEDNT